MNKKLHILALAIAVLLVLACVSSFQKEVRATSSSGAPILEGSTEWYTIGHTQALAVCIDDVDNDGVEEIITGGYSVNLTEERSQLAIWTWDGFTIKQEKSQEWDSGVNSRVFAVFVNDVDNDGIREIITGGFFYDTIRDIAELRIWTWDGLALNLEKNQTWYTISHTRINSVFVDDIDNDGIKEIVTAGFAYNLTIEQAQLTIWTWDGSTTMTLEKNQEWHPPGFNSTRFLSVFVDDVDNDGIREIITGGFTYNLTIDNGELSLWTWDGATLSLEKNYEWYTTSWTFVITVFVDDVEGDGVKEILTGGYFYDLTRDQAQLKIWNWDGLSVLTLEKEQDWYTVGGTHIHSVSVDDVNNDGAKEIITSGLAYDGTRDNGQLRIWVYDTSTFTLQGSQEWYTISYTHAWGAPVSDVDNNGIKEIITGGLAFDGTRYNAQLRVWALPVVDHLTVDVDVGSTYFRGEIAEFYMLTSHTGAPINPTQIVSTLHLPDGTKTSLTAQKVDDGLYKIVYTIASSAPLGIYTLTLEISYKTNAVDLKGAALKSFMVSPTLTQWNAWLLAINQDTATVKTDIGLIKLNLTEINARVTSIDNNIATIDTDIGTIKANISNINMESIPSIVDTQKGYGTTMYVDIALSALAAVGAIGVLIIILKRKKSP